MGAEEASLYTEKGLSLGRNMDLFLSGAQVRYLSEGEVERELGGTDVGQLLTAYLNNREVKQQLEGRVSQLNIGEPQIADNIITIPVSASAKILGPINKHIDFSLVIGNKGDGLSVSAQSNSEIVSKKINQALNESRTDPQTGQVRPPIDINNTIQEIVQDKVYPGARLQMKVDGEVLRFSILNPDFIPARMLVEEEIIVAESEKEKEVIAEAGELVKAPVGGEGGVSEKVVIDKAVQAIPALPPGGGIPPEKPPEEPGELHEESQPKRSSILVEESRVLEVCSPGDVRDNAEFINLARVTDSSGVFYLLYWGREGNIYVEETGRDGTRLSGEQPRVLGTYSEINQVGATVNRDLDSYQYLPQGSVERNIPIYRSLTNEEMLKEDERQDTYRKALEVLEDERRVCAEGGDWDGVDNLDEQIRILKKEMVNIEADLIHEEEKLEEPLPQTENDLVELDKKPEEKKSKSRKKKLEKKTTKKEELLAEPEAEAVSDKYLRVNTALLTSDNFRDAYGEYLEMNDPLRDKFIARKSVFSGPSLEQKRQRSTYLLDLTLNEHRGALIDAFNEIKSVGSVSDWNNSQEGKRYSANEMKANKLLEQISEGFPENSTREERLLLIDALDKVFNEQIDILGIKEKGKKENFYASPKTSADEEVETVEQRLARMRLGERNPRPGENSTEVGGPEGTPVPELSQRSRQTIEQSRERVAKKDKPSNIDRFLIADSKRSRVVRVTREDESEPFLVFYRVGRGRDGGFVLYSFTLDSKNWLNENINENLTLEQSQVFIPELADLLNGQIAKKTILSYEIVGLDDDLVSRLDKVNQRLRRSRNKSRLRKS